MTDWLSSITWVIDKMLDAIGSSRRESTKLCFRLIRTPDEELIEKAYRTRTSDSEYGIEIYNLGQKPYILTYFSICHKKKLLVDCFPSDEEIIIQPYSKIVYTLMEQEYNALKYHCKNEKLKQCEVYAHDIEGKEFASKLDVYEITLIMTVGDTDAIVKSTSGKDMHHG